MKRKTSPHSRTSADSRSYSRGRARKLSPSAARVATKAEKAAQAKQPAPPTTTAGRIRAKSLSVVLPNLSVMVAIVVLALAGVLLSSSPAAWLPAVIAEMWMISHTVPVSGGGITIGVVPLLPALLVMWVIGSRIHANVKKRVSINDLIVLLGLSVAVPLLITLIAWLMLWDAGRVFEIDPPSLLSALPRVMTVHLVGFVLGMGPRLWRALLRHYGIAGWLVSGGRKGLIALGSIGALAAVTLVVAFIFTFPQQGEMLAQYPKLSGMGLASLIILSIFYIPNMIIGAGSVMLGGDYQIGGASISIFDIHLVPLPPLPIMALIPGSAPEWSAAFLAATAVGLVVVIYKVRPTFREAGVAGLCAGLATAVLVYLSSGELGFYGFVGPTAWLTVLLTAVWIGGIGCAVAGGFAFTQWRQRAASPSLELTVPASETQAAEAAVEYASGAGVDEEVKPEAVDAVEQPVDSEDINEQSTAMSPVDSELESAEVSGDKPEVAEEPEEAVEVLPEDTEAEKDDDAKPEADVSAEGEQGTDSSDDPGDGEEPTAQFPDTPKQD